MKQYILAPLCAVVLFSSCGRNRDLISHISDSTAVVYMPQAARLPAEFTFDRSEATVQLTYGACYGGPHMPKGDIQVQFSTDPALAGHFNNEHFTSYPLMPAGSYELEQTSAVIPAGKVNTTPLSITLHLDKLDGVGGYLLPVTIQADSKVNEKLRTTFFLVKALYNTNPFPAIDRTAWKVTGFSSEEKTGEGTANGRTIHALDGNDDTFWTTEWKAAKPGPPHHIVVDMQAATKLHGFTLTGRTDKNTGNVKATGNPKNIIVETSLDGATWDYAENFTLENIKLSTFYLAYSQQARYFRITINTSQGDVYLTNIAEINAF